MRSSNSTRLLVASREARAFLGDAFLLEPERTIGAMFDLCPEDVLEVRSMATGLRSAWFKTARKRLQQGEPIELTGLSGEYRWLAGILNYAMELGEPELDAQPGQASPPASSTRKVIMIGAPVAAALVVAALLLPRGGSTPAHPPVHSVSVAQTQSKHPDLTTPSPDVVKPTKLPALPEDDAPPKETPVSHPRRARSIEEAPRTRHHEVAHRSEPRPEKLKPHVKVERAEPPPSGDSSGPPP